MLFDIVTDRSDKPGIIHAVDLEGQIIGTLEYDADGFVAGVDVDETWRRMGVATAMLDAMPVAPSFPDEDGNTEDGNAWIAAMQQA